MEGKKEGRKEMGGNVKKRKEEVLRIRTISFSFSSSFSPINNSNNVANE